MILSDIALLHQLFLRSSGVSTDSRSIKNGSIFFALKGENFDGNQFALQALKEGAVYSVVSDQALENENGCILVENTLETLQALARYHRRSLSIPVIGITGSNGKTTTKEMLTMVLAKKYRVHATKGNFNNHIGVPLTLLATPAETEIVVCEMGANHVGEIHDLCHIAEPTHGLLTNIGHAHIEGFGSFEGVIKGKGELFDWLRGSNGIAFVNYDDPQVRKLGATLSAKITYGTEQSPDADIVFFRESHGPDVGFSLRNTQVDLVIESPVYGEYNAINAIAAYSVGKHFNVPIQEMVNGFSEFTSSSNRSEQIEFNTCSIIKDAYNANPSSMRVAIHHFGVKHPNGILILGDMKELGSETRSAHIQIIEQTLSFPFSAVFLIGTNFSQAMESLEMPETYFSFPDIHTLQKTWNWKDHERKTILIKGSRSMQLEKLLEA